MHINEKDEEMMNPVMTSLPPTTAVGDEQDSNIENMVEQQQQQREERQRVLSIHNALDRIGFGPFQHRILLAAGMCSAADAMEILMLSFLSTRVQAEWDLNLSEQSGLISSVFAGAFMGTLILGRLGDVWGRRPTFLMTAGIVALGGFGSAICQSYWQLVACRTIVGMGIGGVTIPFDTYGEILPTSQRGTHLAFPSYFWTMGTLLVILGARLTVSSWRALCIWCAIPCLVATCVGYYVVPESPQWLVSRGHSKRALHILRDGAKRNGLNPDDILPLDTRLVLSMVQDHHHHYCLPNNDTEDQELKSSNPEDIVSRNGTEGEIEVWDTLDLASSQSSSSSVYELFTPDRIRTSVSILLMWFGYALLYYGVVLAITAVFFDEDKTTRTTGGGQFDYEAILLASLSEIVATTLTIMTIDRWGRKFLHGLSFGLGGLFILGLCCLASTSHPDFGDGGSSSSSSRRHWSILLAFLSRMWIFSGSAVTWIWTVEVMETKIRTTGHSMANAGGRVGGFLSPYLVSPTRFSYPTIGIILCTFSWILVLLSWWNLPETAGIPMGGGGGGGRRQRRPRCRRSDAQMDITDPEGTSLAGVDDRSLELGHLSMILHRKRQYQSVNVTTTATCTTTTAELT